MKRILSLFALLAFLSASSFSFAAEISAPTVSIPQAPGSTAAPESGGAGTAGTTATPAAPLSLADLQAAAEKGDASAQYQLAEHFGQRNSLDADYGIAAKWYQKAADLGNKDAQFKLGLLYEESLGVSQNLSAAYFWVSLAATSGTKSYVAKRDDLAKRITPEQAAAVTKRVEAWKPAATQPAAPAPAPAAAP